MKDKSTGELLIKDKKITAFSRRGEKIMLTQPALDSHHIDDMQTMLEKVGAKFDDPDSHNWNPMTPYVINDGRIVSGVNPMSASTVAQKTVELIEGPNIENKEPRHAII